MVFDITTSARWQGPPSGIDRLQSRLVGAIAALHPEIRLAIFDPRAGHYRNVTTDAYGLLADPRVVVVDDARTASSVQDLPAAHAALGTGGYGWGTARPLALSLDAVAGAAVDFAPGDLLVDTGAGWEYGAAEIAADLKRTRRIGFAAMCHDLIPLTHPQWCGQDARAAFARHFRVLVNAADAVLFHSRRIAADAANESAAAGLGTVRGRFVPIGAEPIAPRPRALLPPAPAAGRYALAVGTLEPRKGHDLLLDAWRRLEAEGVPARQGFVLVLAGKPGWMTEALAAAIRRQEAAGASLRWLEEVDDALLDRLYRDAAFCVVPSRYEGYGLPAAEALAYGKALICSTGGALPEIAGGICPCLDPDDAPAWTSALRRYVTEPAALAAAAAEVRARFKPTSWAEAARAWVAILGDLRAAMPDALAQGS